jgi:oxygen-dependent protoporphyrinogen oxidase
LTAAVLSVAQRERGWEVTTASSAYLFDQVVIAAPVNVTRELVAPLHAELSGLLDIEATSAVVAAFAFDREASAWLTIPEGFGFLVPQYAQTSSTEPRLLAATFVNQKFSHRAPEGCVLLRAFFGGNTAPGLLSEPDQCILALARRNLSRVLGELPDPEITLVRRWPRSLPQYHVGHLARVARIESIVAELPGLRLIGNGFHGVGLPDLIHQGRQTAIEVLSCDSSGDSRSNTLL